MGNKKTSLGSLGLWDKKAANGGDKSEQDVKALGAQIIYNCQTSLHWHQSLGQPGLNLYKTSVAHRWLIVRRGDRKGVARRCGFAAGKRIAIALLGWNIVKLRHL